jgi:hypothetical protein
VAPHVHLFMHQLALRCHIYIYVYIHK